MSKTIAETISYLIDNVPSDEYSSKLHELIISYQLQKDKIDKTIEINQDINEKIKTTFNFINFVKTICKTSNSSIFGSFPRMLFEDLLRVYQNLMVMVLQLIMILIYIYMKENMTIKKQNLRH